MMRKRYRYLTRCIYFLLSLAFFALPAYAAYKITVENEINMRSAKFNPDMVQTLNFELEGVYPSYSKQVYRYQLTANSDVPFEYVITLHTEGTLFTPSDSPINVYVRINNGPRIYLNWRNRRPLTISEAGTFEVFVEWPEYKTDTRYKGRRGNMTLSVMIEQHE